MAGIVVDVAQIKDYAKRVGKTLPADFDYEEFMYAWSKDVTNAVAHSHSRKYSYTTPPASDRVKLRKRSGRIAQAIKAGRRFHRLAPDAFAIEFDINIMRQVAPYIGYHLDTSYTGKNKSKFYRDSNDDYILIPLRGALNSDGTLAIDPPITNVLWNTKAPTSYALDTDDSDEPYAYMRDGFFWVRYKDIDHFNIDVSGENTSKFHDNTLLVCLDGTPCFIAAKTVEIPLRLKLGKEVKYYFDRPSGYGSLDTRLEKELQKLLRKKAR